MWTFTCVDGQGIHSVARTRYSVEIGTAVCVPNTPPSPVGLLGIAHIGLIAQGCVFGTCIQLIYFNFRTRCGLNRMSASSQPCAIKI